MIEYNNTKTMGITSIDNGKVEVKIPLTNGGFWEKEYNKSDLIQQLINDFKEENNEDIPEEYMNDWKEKNESFKMTDEIRTLVPNEINTCLVFSQRVHNIVVGEEEKIPDFIGKPFSDPFEVIVFHKRDKSLKIQKYDYNTINEEGLNHYSSSSAYCNGDNNLFISGGEKRDGNIIEKFWKINLENQAIETFKMPPKKNHSMIYISGGYTFIVGGNDKKTYFFDDQNNQICKSSDLNNNRTEPALILVSDSLYCFDNINSKNSDEPFTCEKMDLKEDNPKWVLITPIIDSSIINQKMNQKFFGVAKTNDNNVLFLGGNMDNNQEEGVYNYKYVIGGNVIEPSDVPFQEYNLKEKTFLTFKKDIEYILPDFNRLHPEVLFFQKNKNKLSLLKYEPKTTKSKDNDSPIIEHKFNFNMPIIIPNNNNKEKADLNIDKNKDIDIKKSGGYNLGIDTGNIGEIKVDIGGPNIEIQNPSYNINIESKNLPNKSLDDNQENKKIFSNDSKNINMDLNGMGGIITPNINIETNKGTDNIKGNLDIGGEIKIDGPEINPDIHLPQTDDKPPTITDNFNLNVPEIKINGDFDGPKIDLNKDISTKILLDDIIKCKEEGNIGNNDLNLKLNTPQINIEGTKIDSNINHPKFDNESNNSQIKFEGPKIDSNLGINFNNPDIKIDGPKIDTSIKPPNYENPQIEIAAPKLDTNIQNPNLNIEVNIPKIESQKIEGKIEGPNLNMKEDNIQNLNINGTNINIPSGKIDIERPKINNDLNGNLKIKTNLSNINFNKDFFLEGTIIGTKDNKNLKKDSSLNGIIPGAKGNVNINLEGSKKNDEDIYMSGIIDPNIKLKGNAPGMEIKGPKLSIPSTDINVNKNININGNIAGFDGAKIDSKFEPNIELPSANLKINKPTIKKDDQITGIIPGKNVNLKAPNVDIKGNNDIISGTIPGIKVNGPKIGVPKIDINKPGMNVNLKAPNVDIKGNNDNFITGTIPGIKVNGPKIDVPKIDINKPGMNVKLDAPNVDIKGNNNDIITGTIPGMNVKLDAPNVDIKGNNIITGDIPGIKVNGPKIDVPKFDVNGPGMNVNLKAPNVDIKGKDELSGIIPGIKSGKVDIKGPKVNVNAPSAKVNIKEPNINVKGPHYKAYINERDSYISGVLPGINDIKTSNINLPSGKFDIEGPKISTNINGNQNINLGKLEGPNVDLNFKGDKINIPDINIKNSDLNGNIDGKINLKGQNPNLNGKTDFNLNGPKISIDGPSINNMNDFVLAGIIPSKNEKNREIIYDKSINVNGDINSKLNTKNKLNFHGNENDINLDLGELKGSRKVKDSNMNELDYNLKVSQNKLNISGNNFQTEPINTNILINQGNNIQNDLNLDIKNPIINLQYPKFDVNTDNKMDFKGSNNLEIGGGEIGGGLNLSKNNDENKFGFNVNIGGGNKGIDIDTNFNELKNSYQEDKNKENKNILNNGVSIRRNFNTKLPMVGVKDNNFISSKIAEAGRFDGDNINIDITKTANVGINGQKMGDRIEY